MELKDVFIGAEVEHVRDGIRGLVVKVIEQPEPSPVHVDVLTVVSGTFTLPINQLRLVATRQEVRVRIHGEFDGGETLAGVVRPREPSDEGEAREAIPFVSREPAGEAIPFGQPLPIPRPLG